MNRNELRKRLRSFAGTRTKVRLTRRFPSEPLHNGFILACGREWVLFRQFHDFYPEGFTTLRVQDISEIRSGDCERHWERMLAAEGALARLAPPGKVDLDDISRLLKGLQRRRRNIIIECEDPDEDVKDFYIGKILQVEKTSVRFANFDGMGRWDDAPKVIPLGEITKVQINTPYADTFSKYLEGPFVEHRSVRGGRGRRG